MATDKEITEELEKRLDDDRAEWMNKLKKLIESCKFLDEISTGQSLMLSYRMMIVDKIIKLTNLKSKKQCSIKGIKKEYYDKYKREGYNGLKLGKDEMYDYINADFRLKLRQVELFEAQILFYNKCIETLDKLGFAYKNKLSIDIFS